MLLDAASVEAAKVRTTWADDVFVSTAFGKPDAELSKVVSEDELEDGFGHGDAD